jgi:fibronectin type 3 domain-containing protein
MVRTFVSPKKLSASSNAASLTIFPAPDPIADLKAELVSSGVTLTWTPPQKTIIGTPPQISFYRVYRSEADSNATQTPTPTNPLARIADPASPPYTDTQAELGKTYIYSVRAVSEISSEPLESLDSNFASVTRKDIFPPSAPQNLVVVFVPAVTGTPAHLELSWAINPETDIAGYNIYRSEEQHRPGTRINAELLQTPAFRDMNVATGREYFYTVTAVDRSGNESPAGAPASGSIPAENQSKQDPSSE